MAKDITTMKKIADPTTIPTFVGITLDTIWKPACHLRSIRQYA